MFSINFLLQKSNCIKLSRSVKGFLGYSKYSVCKCYVSSRYNEINQSNSELSVITKRFYAKGFIDKLIHEQSEEHQKELNKISVIFPQPRVTLNELTSKTPDNIFDISYKQTVVTPKGSKRKTVFTNDWTCVYTFTWPEKVKFESTAKSKRQAAEKAALQAVQWLFNRKCIDIKGNPMYDRNVINELKDSLDHKIQATVTENSIERLNRIFDDYERDIKNLYEETFVEASKRMAHIQPVLLKDSTIDEDGGELADSTTELADFEDFRMNMHPVYGKSVTPSPSFLSRRQRVLKEKFDNYDEGLTPLPIDQYIDEITSTIDKSRVTVIVGAAGCGKSTRVPAAILRKWRTDAAAIVSEPRRVAAIGLAQRVADELHENVGECIGYQVRLQSKLPRPGGGVLFCTSGVLLRRLQFNPGLEGCSHVVIDEAHERDVNTDLTLLLLRRALDLNPTLKLVVMSATLDTEVFTRYFKDTPVIEVPGRTYPVTVYHLNEIQKKFSIRLPNTKENCEKNGKPYLNCQEIVEVIKAVDKNQQEGAILVFLPGWAEIKQVQLLLQDTYRDSTLHMIIPVHSRLSTADQTRMFHCAAAGVRRIVLATNIAETSITVPDVVHVVDAGAHRENRIRETTGTASLETVWVSLAGAKQRAGRAGRVQPGICYRLYTKEKEEEFAPHTTPEILRVPLDQIVLDCKSYAPDEYVEDFLSQLPEPPSKKMIKFAVDDLIDLGALTSSQRLTRLGSILAPLSLPPRLGASLLSGAILGGVVAAANVTVHCADSVELFHSAADRREEIRGIKSEFNKTSDHAALHWIQDTFEQKCREGRDAVAAWCDRYGLRIDRLRYVKSISNLYLENLLKSGVMGEADGELNRFSDIDELTTAILLSGSNSLLTTKKYVKTKGKLATTLGVFTSKGERAHISTESVNYGIKKSKHGTHLLTYFGGHHSLERRALVVYKTSLISPHTALLFASGNIATEKNEDDDTTMIQLQRHKLQIEMPTRQAEAILKAREMLWNTIKYYIERDLKTINYDDVTNVGRFKIRLVKAIGRILVEAEQNLEAKSSDYMK
ncbi:ATP-dependent RNA helicase DHX30-like [Aricia agestis]|uniref:ATP-dependent RNA helicase DHX30-like n=1 Tax=Aricia agestis TaxID=91739 RepID=UPI001C205EE1|nr:ATP-dependent RNA helicase DHX30-like [Aricia agestis]